MFALHAAVPCEPCLAATPSATRSLPLLSQSCRSFDGSCALSCRHRRFTNLTLDQLALAREGSISERLRSNSPVYYWQVARQRRSRREAICSKRAAWHAITFGSHGKYADLAAHKCHRASRARPPIDSCTNLTLADLPPRWARANGATRNTRGAGYWKWKPFTLLRKLQAMGDEEVLVHFDYDLAIGHNLTALYCLGQNAPKGVAVFHFPCWTDRGWTKRELADAMNATDQMLDTAQIYGGLVVLRKTPFALRFVREWLQWATSGELITDTLDRTRQHDGFHAHRHDQSILSLLSKRHRIKSFPMPTAAHDPRDIWSWDAGYCQIQWPLPTYRTRVDPYVTHYKEMGGAQDSMRHCEKTCAAATCGSRRPLSPSELADSPSPCDVRIYWSHACRASPCLPAPEQAEAARAAARLRAIRGGDGVDARVRPAAGERRPGKVEARADARDAAVPCHAPPAGVDPQEQPLRRQPQLRLHRLRGVPPHVDRARLPRRLPLRGRPAAVRPRRPQQ